MPQKPLKLQMELDMKKNGQVLRVAYAKSTHGPVSGSSQSNNLAAAAMEAASFAQKVCSSNTVSVTIN
jgi:RNA-binding protein 5/10